MRLLRAGWVLPMVADPIADGAVAVRGDAICDVGPAAELVARHPEAALDDLGADAVLLPGLVDAHCHLEWSCFDGVVPPQDFGAWLGAFLPLRARMDAGDHAVAAAAGAMRALRAGTTTVADAGPTGAGEAALRLTGQRGVVHLEAFGAPDGVAAREQAHAVAARVEELAAGAPERVRVGLSPHAPYSVGPQRWRALAEEATLATRPWATHIAESPDEERAVLEGTGAIAGLFADAGFPMGRWDGDGDSVVARIDGHGALREGLVAAHCVRLRRGDAARLRRARVAVAHCPRSNVHLRCGTAPVPALCGAGVLVAMGTDSPASGGDYDLRAEARACRDLFGAAAPPNHQLLRMVTHDAARALGMGDAVGALEPGMQADLLVLRASDPVMARAAGDPFALALDPATQVETATVAGRAVLRRGDPVGVDAGAVMAEARTIAARLR